MSLEVGASDHLSIFGRRLVLPSGMTVSEATPGGGDVTIANGGSITSGMLRGARVWSLGDSITVGNGGHTGSGYSFYGDKNWQAWAELKSGGAFYFEDFAATGGFTTTQIIATHLPTVLAASPKPNMCVVLCGINDMTTGAVGVPAVTITNLKTIYSSLLAAGILPIACTIPPKNGYTEGPASLNAWISRYARDNGFPVLDFYGLLVDPSTSNYVALYDAGDGTHPSPQGAQIMGAYIANQFAYWFTPTPAWSSQTNTDVACTFTNTCLLTDTNADGVPDNWTLNGAGATATLATDAGVNGNRWQITRGANDLTAAVTTAAADPAAGHKFYASIKLRFDAIPTSGYIYCHIADSTFANSIIGCPVTFNANLWTVGDAGQWYTFQCEATVPVGMTGARFQIGIKGASGTQISVAQPTIIDLTALGLV